MALVASSQLPSDYLGAAGRRPALVIVTVVAASLLLFIVNAGAIPLADRDEGRYAEIGREMFTTGDLRIPNLFGVPYLEKPPLLYWLLSASYSAFGVNEFAARLPIALAAAVGVLASALLAGKVIDPRAGPLAASLLATSGLYFVLARLVLTDMLFAAAIACALMVFFAAHNQLIGQWWGYLAFWLFLAIATLSKGPAGALLCSVVILIDLVLAREVTSLRRARLWMGLPLYLILSVPWFALVQYRFPEFLKYYISNQHLARLTGSEHSESFYFFVPWLLVGLLPWTLLALAAVPIWIGEFGKITLESRLVRFLTIWSAVVFVTFSASGGKLITYILPMYPALAVLLAVACHRWLIGGAVSSTVKWAFIATVLLVLAIGAGALIVDRAFAVPRATWLCSALALLLSALALSRVGRRLDVGALGLLVASVGVLYVAVTFAAPAIAASYTAKSVLLTARTRLKAGDEVAMAEVYYPSVAFYLGRIPYVVDPNRELEFGESLAQATPHFVRDLAELKSRVGSKRLLCLTGPRPQDLQELRRFFPNAKVLAHNRTSTLALTN